MDFTGKQDIRVLGKSDKVEKFVGYVKKLSSVVTSTGKLCDRNELSSLNWSKVCIWNSNIKKKYEAKNLYNFIVMVSSPVIIVPGYAVGIQSSIPTAGRNWKKNSKKERWTKLNKIKTPVK